MKSLIEVLDDVEQVGALEEVAGTVGLRWPVVAPGPAVGISEGAVEGQGPDVEVRLPMMQHGTKMVAAACEGIRG